MRQDEYRAPSRVLIWFLGAMLAGFILQNIFVRWLGNGEILRYLAVTPAGLRDGHVWTLLTYTLLHGGILHLLFNGLFLYFLGRELAPLLGTRHFLAFSAGAAAFGALVWFVCHWGAGLHQLIGASAVVMGLFVIFACIYPDREITFLLFFVLPVTLRPRVAVWILLAIESLGFLFSELPGGRYDTNIAYSAHLGGMLAGWLYFRFVHGRSGWERASSLSVELPAWLRRRRAQGDSAPVYKVDVPSKSRDIRAEVDRVLDKINSQGFGALTEEEKRILDQAKDMLSRH
jgi:membrane associated rhomboid family serine protease